MVTFSFADVQKASKKVELREIRSQNRRVEMEFLTGHTKTHCQCWERIITALLLWRINFFLKGRKKKLPVPCYCLYSLNTYSTLVDHWTNLIQRLLSAGAPLSKWEKNADKMGAPGVDVWAERWYRDLGSWHTDGCYNRNSREDSYFRISDNIDST